MKVRDFFIPVAAFIMLVSVIYACSSGSSEEIKIQGFIDHGVLKVDKNGRYFEFADGTPFVPVGLNHFLIYRKGHDIDSMMRLWSQNGVNYLRIWAGLGADPEIAVGEFDEKQMQALDSVIFYCTKYGIHLNISFWNENCIREQKGDWGWNGKDQIYNKEHSKSGTTANADDMRDTLHTATWNAMKNRYAYFVNRWKDKPIIIMWDLANDSKKTNAWKAGMYDYVKKLDGTGRLVTFQYNTSIDPKGEMDCGSVRIYGYNPAGNDPEVMMTALAGRIKEAIAHGDPVYVGEGGMDYPDNTEYNFERGFLHFLWAPVAVGAAGNLHPWVSPPTWPELTEQKLKWIKNFSTFCQTVKWNEFNSRNIDDKVKPSDSNVKAFACADSKEILLYLMNDDPQDKFEPLKTTLTVSAEMASGKYSIEWIDIRTGKILNSKKISTFPAEIKTPEFRDGIFGHIRKAE
jgi:mannan endo-1,4-beta-mannosidase